MGPEYHLVPPLVRETLVTLGHEFLYDRIQVCWMPRFTAKIGDARYAPYPRVRFSVPLWPLAGPEERRETVIHEVCHVVDAYLATTAGYRRDGKHGQSWLRLMKKCGAEGSRCHSIKRPPEMLRNVKRAEVKCACSTYTFGQQRLARMARGFPYTCQKCRTKVALIAAI